jgi:hypothetical protein
MKPATGFLGVGIIGGIVLTSSIGAGYLEQRLKPQVAAESSFGKGVTAAQMMERRRGRAATAAVAEAAVQ